MSGPIVTGRMVRDEVEALLKLWLPSTLAHVCRQHGLAPDAVPQPRQWLRLIRPEALLDAADQLPIVVVATPDRDRGITTGDGFVDGTFTLLIEVAARGQTFNDTPDINDLYTAAIELALTQHPALGALDARVNVTGGGFRPIGRNTDRTMIIGQVVGTVYAQKVASVYGLTEAPADPLAPVPAETQITSHDIIVAGVNVGDTP